jgi:GNAT superfamily N-acetyltransferase
MEIDDLGQHRAWIGTIAGWHFDQWGPLTGAATLAEYVDLLERAVESRRIPSVLVAFDATGPLGSASLLASDMTIRPELTPWLAQLFVTPAHRATGIGSALVETVAQRAGSCGFSRLYLYTSGDLPRYYVRLGWTVRERLAYLGKERAVMERQTVPGQ